MSHQINRRTFLKTGSLTTAGVLLAKGSYPEIRGIEPAFVPYDLMQEVRKYRKLDAYCTAPFNMEQAERLGIDRMYTGKPMIWADWTPDQFIAANDEMIALMKRYPGKVVGQITLNPKYGKESLAEIDRCVDQGMVGTRLYYQVKINDPLYFPVIEKLTDLKMMIFVHGEAQLGVGGYEMKYDVGRPPTVSRPEDFVEAAIRYPEAMFQFAHIGGGSDWEYMCKCFADYPNIFVDTGGSNNEADLIDFAVKLLGEDRLFFGTDNSYFQGVGKILAAELTERQKEKLFFDNYNAVLKKGGYDVH